MGSSIHARRTPDGLRYRVWGSIVDAYLTPALTEAELRVHLLDDYSPRAVDDGRAEIEIAARLARANSRGTSHRSFSDGHCSLDEPWETERCRSCQSFHHAYDPRPSGTCGYCGEGADDRSHLPPCEVPHGR